MVRSSPLSVLNVNRWISTPVPFDEPHREEAIRRLLNVFKGLPGTALGPRHPPRHLQQIRLHVGGLVLAMPFGREEVLEAVGLEPDGTVDETVLVDAGAVPERVVIRMQHKCYFRK